MTVVVFREPALKPLARPGRSTVDPEWVVLAPRLSELVRQFCDYASVFVFGPGGPRVVGWASSLRVSAEAMADMVQHDVAHDHPALIAAYEGRSVVVPRVQPGGYAPHYLTVKAYAAAARLHAHSELAAPCTLRGVGGAIHALRADPSLPAFTEGDGKHLVKFAHRLCAPRARLQTAEQADGFLEPLVEALGQFQRRAGSARAHKPAVVVPFAVLPGGRRADSAL